MSYYACYTGRILMIDSSPRNSSSGQVSMWEEMGVPASSKSSSIILLPLGSFFCGMLM